MAIHSIIFLMYLFNNESFKLNNLFFTYFQMLYIFYTRSDMYLFEHFNVLIALLRKCYIIIYIFFYCHSMYIRYTSVPLRLTTSRKVDRSSRPMKTQSLTWSRSFMAVTYYSSCYVGLFCFLPPPKRL